ncbi:hypothetical protein U879_12380 [Defluviimonas sp. 20V17]|uniref:Glycosyl transferase family 2 n=1 Tax=Allgaiera indica TaxID=765699 RepID=A0AAN4ZYR2_9RHOB|nr:glycosyltransferase family 2 protein [Allgaiera indica]KDB03372.1 hypothetical protein U879_12380 [Defluviimonas sp. 20V17]GHD98587.1 hypothetical protein GCM10008024_02700 [Allgaiera indica]SDW10349.1 Glycosyl transferase family 2 [Allgaiera indica]
MALHFSIVIPTYRRPGDLSALLALLAPQVAAFGADCEVIVVDNCPDASSRATVAAAPMPATYRHEPRAGVAHARNTGVASARGRHVIFIDDDQRPVPDWLTSLAQLADAGHAAVFGPVRPTFETPPPVHLRTALEPLFTREMGVATGTDISDRRAYLGTGNSMFERARCFTRRTPFDPRFNRGGEDVWFLRGLVQDTGVRLTWCEEAAVDETVPAARMTAAYVRARRFRNGQLRCIVEAGGGNRAAVLFWMAAGGAQALGYGLGAAAVLPFDRRAFDGLRARAAGGLGKLMWWWPAGG